MKKIFTLFLTIVLVFSMVGCSRTMNDIISNEPNMTGIVTEVFDTYIMVESNGGLYHVSLDVENKDSTTHFSVGDEVIVYYNGEVAESDPAQILTVYAILLKTPANREENNKS